MMVPPPVPMRLWLLPVGLGLLGAPLWLHVWEPALFLALNRACAPLPTLLWTGLSLLGNAWGVLGLTAPLLLLAPRLMRAWVCAAPFAIVFARLGKGLIESPRPAAVVDNAQMHVVGELLHNVSMPSGHTLTAFAVASGIYFALPVAGRRKHLWLFALAAGVGLSRIAVGAHWPGDVAVGASLGIFSGLLGQPLLARIGTGPCRPQAWSLRLLALLVGVAAFHLASAGLDFDEALPVQYLLAALSVVALLAFVRQSAKPAR